MKDNFVSRSKDSICALASPLGLGGISLIRLSGPDCIHVIKKIFSKFPKKLESHKVYYGFIKDLKGNFIDEVLLTYFKKGSSFTGEESFELSCHGSPYLSSSILNLLHSQGIRLADKGEFSFRSFMNGKIDLVQAESILSLTQSQSELESKWALRSLQGDFSKKVLKWKKNLVFVLSHLEASIDFSEEALETAPAKDLEKTLKETLKQIKFFLKHKKENKTVREGLRLCFAGSSNSGKSTLFNALLKEDVSLVSSVKGTTTDVLKSSFCRKKLQWTFFDTAGMREEPHLVEKMGIEKAMSVYKEADFIFFVFDLSKDDWSYEISQLEKLDLKKCFFIGNKTDKAPISLMDFKKKFFLFWKKQEDLIDQKRFFLTCALHQKGLESLEKALDDEAKKFDLSEMNLLSLRQIDQLEKIHSSLQKGVSSMDKKMSPEFVISDLNETLNHCLYLLGERYEEQVLDQIFKEFCIGK